MILAAIAATLILTSFTQPSWLNDDNRFLANFVNHELLATLGFIVAITLASSANLHLELNKIEDETGNGFIRTRASIQKSAYALLVLIGIAAALVVVKPLLPGEPEWAAFANSVAILILYFNLSVLYALTRTVFGIPTVKRIKEKIAAARRQQSGSL
jgi:hypothetical protein